jgi:RHS repeat-associated protein
VQSKSGETMELGAPLDTSDDAGALETDPNDSTRIFRWNLTRQYDAYGTPNPPAGTQPSPVNQVVYRYTSDGSLAYLGDIYDTAPAANPTTAPLSAYAHHVHLSYEARTDATFSFRRGWQVTQGRRLVGVDVTSANFGASGPRELVRRYHLAYDGAYHVSLLTNVQMEGRCPQPVTEDSTGLLPATSCPTLPAMTFGYQHVAPFDTSGSPSSADIAGWEGFDERVHAMANSPDHSIDESLTDLFDINADGLPDVVVTAPFLYNGKHAVFFNGAVEGPLSGGVARGTADAFGGNQCLDVTGVAGEDTNVIRLDNANVAAHDIDGDGIIDLLHMPIVKTYSVYTPQRASPCWLWQGRAIDTASGQSPKIDFTNHNDAIKVMDVNGDGLVDVVFSSGTEYQTFFSLGRFPQGDGQYGSAQWTGAATSSISNDPVTSCLPWSATPALLSDSDVKIADMNGDGLPDIVRVRAGDVRYWPGRGNGFWGTGDAASCPGGGFGQNQDIAMTTSPQFGVVDSTESLLLDDINGDGLDDLVKVEFEAVYIWLNVDGTGWTSPHIINNSPPRSPTVDRMRLVDANGSGTRDLLYGDGYAYKYIDVNGGSRPWVLTHVDNGLGKTTDVDYGSSTQFMLAAAQAGTPWTSVAPMPIHVVTQVTERDHLDAVGLPAGAYVTQYSYRDAVYDGRQREFRGFRTGRARRVGDANSPSSTSVSTFLLGECANDENAAPDPCSEDGRWEDNPREALKGLPLTTETFDDSGVYLSSAHNTYRLRKLYTGADGREVRAAFQSASDTFLYDTASFVAGSGASASLTDVELETTLGSATADTTSSLALRARAVPAHLQRSTLVDPFGNATDAIDAGCVDGCASADEVITAHTSPGLPAADTSGWMWRTVESYVVGSVNSGQRKHLFFTYDGGGNPTRTSAELIGTLPLDRFHEDSTKQVAPTLPSASQDTTAGQPLLMIARTYDPFGFPVHEAAPNGRCRSVTPDASFHELPVLETVSVGPLSTLGSDGCGSTGLSTVAVYDRGLGVVTSVTDLHGELTTASYDGFGRISTLTKPDPANVGSVSGAPSLQFHYALPSNPAQAPFSVVSTDILDGPDTNAASFRTVIAVVDGLGRTILSAEQADMSAGDVAPWIIDGVTEYDRKGAVARVFQPSFANVMPPSPPLTPQSAYSQKRYDAFGRVVQTYGIDGAISLRSVYHTMSVDLWDAADLQPGGQHQGTFATSVRDGHGRTTVTTERVHNGSAIEAHDTRTTYLPTGEPVVSARVRVGAADPPVVRWLRYDSLGRMVLNVEPNTTKGFNADPSTDPASMKAWRYAYDVNGDLVGTSDARGCGANYHYDAGGRVVAEDFSPCLSSQQDYSTPDLGTGDGTEASYQYDALPAALSNIAGFPIDQSLLLGRLVAISDRGSQTVTRYDGRGRTTGVARFIAVPGVPSDALAARYAPHPYVRAVDYDGADRPVNASTGADVAPLVDTNQPSVVTTRYSQRGTIASVTSSYGGLVNSVVRDADGLISQITYSDVAGTTTALSYDVRRRPSSVQTYRGTPAIWSQSPPAYSPAPDVGGPPSTLQLLLEDVDYKYDAVDNPTEIDDFRNPAEWPAGAQPVTRQIHYDDLYRATRVDYQHPGGTDPWTSPFAAEDAGTATDTRLATPSPHVAFDNRVTRQSFQYDWLGNTTATDDDAHGFYDRSLGTIGNGTAGAGPYQLLSASGATSARSGSLSTAYDAAGNLSSLAINRSGPCLPQSASCSQRFVYDWDEVGRLARARRWDLTSPLAATDSAPSATANVELRYAYDANDGRVLKTAVDPQGNEVHTAYVFASLEIRRSGFEEGDYDRTGEVAYLFANGVRLARVEPMVSSVPGGGSPTLHVLLELPDHLGSTQIVVDAATSEVVERGTYMAYGQAESDYRPARWGGFREDYRFTGKEEDVEVGLQYFGKRYYAGELTRWASVDPLTLHALGGDANVYAYVHGLVFRTGDPTGLAEDEGAGVSFCSSSDCTADKQAKSDTYQPPKNPDVVASFSNTGPASWGRSVPAPAPTGPNASIQPPTSPDDLHGVRFDDPAEGQPSFGRAPPPSGYQRDFAGMAQQPPPPIEIHTPSQGEIQDDRTMAIGAIVAAAAPLLEPEVAPASVAPRTAAPAAAATPAAEALPVLPKSVGAASNITTVSRIAESSFAVRQAEALSTSAQRDVDALLGQLRAGNMNPGIGTRSLGGTYLELRGANAGRVIVNRRSAGSFDIVGKFQGHVRGDAANSAIIQRLIRDYEGL